MSFVRAVPAALLLALAAPAVAQANATLSVAGTAPQKTLTLTVDDALDHVTYTDPNSGDLVIFDSVGIAVGASGCIAVDAHKANCGPKGDFELAAFEFAGGNDQFFVDGAFPIELIAEGGAGNDALYGGLLASHLDGGPGNDYLWGGPADDDLVGGEGDDFLFGGRGVDAYDGGPGDDDLRAQESPPVADAAISCGSGNDTLLEDDIDELPGDCELYEPPYLDGDLRITGTPQVGSALGLSLPTNIGGDGVATIQWERCDATGYACVDIFGEQDATYTPVPSDRDRRLRARYSIENVLGDDWVESEATEIVALALQPPHHPIIPHPPPTQHTPNAPRLVLGPFLVARAPSFAIRNGKPVVDTGRSIRCVGAPSVSCQLSVTARPSGGSARLRGRPSIAGATHVLVAGGAQKKVTLSLNRSAYRLLRAHRKLTLSVTAVLTRPGYVASQATFTVTVNAPKRHRH